MDNCIFCHSQIKKNEIICKTCSQNPFVVEKYRSILARDHKRSRLLKTYNKEMAEIKNINTSIFWDKKIIETLDLSKQGTITKDRIKIAVSYLPSDAKMVLDVGAGQGYLEEALSINKDIRLYANDFSKNGIESLSKRFKGIFTVQSIYNLNYSQHETFDTIFILEVLEHIPPSKVFGVLKDLNRLLNKNGILIVSVPMNEGLEYMDNNPNGHVRDYSRELIIAELKLSGFNVLEFKELYAFRNFYKLKLLLSKYFFKNRWKSNDIVIKAQKK